MAGDTILQHPVAQKFIYPFLLVFFIVFAVLEKTKALGDSDNQKQINALVSFVIGLIFVSAVSPKMVVQDMILFLTVALIITFVILLLWGFISGSNLKGGENLIIGKKLKGWVVAVIVIAVVIALLSSLGVSGAGVMGFLFGPGTEVFWTNFLFIAAIAVALAVVLSKTKSG